MVVNFRKRQKREMTEKEKKKQLSQEFLAAIQPQGGVKFEDKYIKKGDGYETCLRIWDFPTSRNELWLDTILSQNDVIAVRDIANMNKNEIVDAINKSMTEHELRYMNSKDQTDQTYASNRYQEMQNLFNEISEMGEVVKLMHLRLYIHAQGSIENLEKKVEQVMAELTANGFRGQIFLNEMEWEWRSMFLPYEEQQKLPNVREGKGVPGLTLAAGLPYNFSYLDDPNGSYLGVSTTKGNVLFDLFYRDDARRFFNGVVVGKMGAGKSTLLKKIAFDNAARGNYIRGFDVTGEFATLVDAMNGHLVALDGSQGIINVLQVFKTVDNSQSKDKNSANDEELSFMQHIAKVTTFYQFLSKDHTSEEVEEFKRVLRLFYESFGIDQNSKNITSRSPEEYPIFSDFLRYLKDTLYSDVEKEIIRAELTPGKVNRLEKIVLIIENLVNTYSHLFDGHTSVPNLLEEQVVFFSIRNLTSLESSVFNAQLFNALNMIWDNLIQIGAPQMKRIYEDPNFNEQDVQRLLVLIDESHRMINSENMLAVSFLTEFAREARKYFGGLLLASQSIRDFVPDHADNETVSKIRTLFELTQYKFIMQQDTNALDAIRKIFDDEMTESELSRIPHFKQGDCLLSISGVQNITLSVEASEEELNLFTGGL